MRNGALVWLFFGSSTAFAQPIRHYDEFDANLASAVGEVDGRPLPVQSGFAQGEAFGQVFRPSPADYPLSIRAVELILANPPMATGPSMAEADVEIWNSTATGADPGTVAPIFSASTGAFFDPMTAMMGFPLQGDRGLRYEFDWSDPLNHPPPITEGNVWVMIRFRDPSADRRAEWQTAGCSMPPGCGCQAVGALLDTATTPNVNVLHILPGVCSGTASVWTYAEALPIVGDFILRLVIGDGACTPDCTARECGLNGCGGVCGSCALGSSCSAGMCMMSDAGTDASVDASVDDGGILVDGGGSCTLHTDCLNGTYCSDAGTCARDCRADIDCTTGAFCDSIGRCVSPGSPSDGGCSCRAAVGVSPAGHTPLVIFAFLAAARFALKRRPD